MIGKLPLQGACLALALLLTACGSTPSWDNYSEGEIGDWKEINIDAEYANKFTKAGLSSTQVKAWQLEGFHDNEAILAWSGTGFSSVSAGQWNAIGFGLDDARDWAKEKFSAEDADRWVKGGFSLKEAEKNRSKGLSPTQ